MLEDNTHFVHRNTYDHYQTVQCVFLLDRPVAFSRQYFRSLTAQSAVGVVPSSPSEVAPRQPSGGGGGGGSGAGYSGASHAHSSPHDEQDSPSTQQ